MGFYNETMKLKDTKPLFRAEESSRIHLKTRAGFRWPLFSFLSTWARVCIDSWMKGWLAKLTKRTDVTASLTLCLLPALSRVSSCIDTVWRNATMKVLTTRYVDYLQWWLLICGRKHFIGTLSSTQRNAIRTHYSFIIKMVFKHHSRHFNFFYQRAWWKNSSSSQKCIFYQALILFSYVRASSLRKLCQWKLFSNTCFWINTIKIFLYH